MSWIRLNWIKLLVLQVITPWWWWHYCLCIMHTLISSSNMLFQRVFTFDYKTNLLLTLLTFLTLIWCATKALSQFCIHFCSQVPPGLESFRYSSCRHYVCVVLCARARMSGFIFGWWHTLELINCSYSFHTSPSCDTVNKVASHFLHGSNLPELTQ